MSGSELAERFRAEVGDPFAMDWRIVQAEQRKRVYLLASKYDHCLLDLLWRWRRGELAADIVGAANEDVVDPSLRLAQGLREGIPLRVGGAVARPGDAKGVREVDA